jgi:uncharacterized protein with HEPN domain
MPPPDEHDASLLLDMLESARRALSYTQGRSRQDLDRDSMLSDAIQIIGEAARGVSADFQQAHPEIQWRPIMATRHILAHDYDAVNFDIVWRICEEHLPPLIAQLTPLLAAHGPSSEDPSSAAPPQGRKAPPPPPTLPPPPNTKDQPGSDARRP